MKILILGATGVLGSSIYDYLKRNHYDVYSCGFSQNAEYNFDALKENNLKKFIEAIKPKVVINCIVNRDVNKCNKNFFYGYDLNVKMCEIITKVIFKKKIHLIHFSTDQVYKNKYHNKKLNSIVNPINFYGLTKLIGEKIISSHKNHTIIRTNFFNANLKKKISQSEWIFNRLIKNKKVAAAYNIIFNPISTEKLLNIILDIILKKIYGTFDIGSGNSISKFEFAKNIAKKYSLNKSLVIKYKNISEVTLRPNNTLLNNNEIEKKLKYKIK